MNARLRKLVADLGEAFWIIPFLMVVGGIFAGVGLVSLDRSGLVPEWLIESVCVTLQPLLRLQSGAV